MGGNTVLLVLCMIRLNRIPGGVGSMWMQTIKERVNYLDGHHAYAAVEPCPYSDTLVRVATAGVVRLKLPSRRKPQTS